MKLKLCAYRGGEEKLNEENEPVNQSVLKFRLFKQFTIIAIYGKYATIARNTLIIKKSWKDLFRYLFLQVIEIWVFV